MSRNPQMDNSRDALRIGIICYPLIGGSGILATALGMELARRGHEAHFFSYERPVRLDVDAPRVHFHEVRVSEYSLFKYPDYTLPLAVKLASISRSQVLDVLHAHYAVPHATAAYLAAQMLGGVGQRGVPKIVTTLHGTDATLLGQDPSYRPAIEHALANSDAITTVSRSLRDETLATFELHGKSVDVIHNFFVPSTLPANGRAALRRELGIAENTFLVIHPSNLRPGKRIDLLLRTMAAALTRQPPVPMRLLILGGGDFSPHDGLVEELGLRKYLLLRENVLDVDAYIAAADAGLMTSENESFGLSLLETLFFGKPVVAFRVGGIPEVVTDGENGFLRPFGDVDGLADALVRLAASPELALAMGAEGRRVAEAKFSAALIVPQYETVYRRLLAD